MVRRVLLLLLLATAPAIASNAGAVSVDYVIGMIESGLDPEAIIGHIVDNRLTFRLSKGNLDRLREAGASDELIGVVRDRAATGRDDWERPRRLGEYGDIWSDRDEDEEDQEDAGRAVYYGGYAHYGPWYGYYPWFYGPFLYDPFFAHYPYYSYYIPRQHFPRLHGGFHGRGFSPRGDRIAPRGSPPAGRSSGGGRTRTAPRGSR